jgi:regulator of replication initiation timing
MMNEMEMTLREYREDRIEAYAELSEKLGHMIHDLQQLQKKVDSARESNKRANIDTSNITMLVSTMMMMTNTASRIAKDNEVLMALGDMK